jgi:superfamily I DNA and/or RNA helicase
VVVPHRAPRAALKEALPAMLDLLDSALDESAVDTVERFQGGERTAILVSATESDPDYLRSAGEFLLDPRRLNVALSRAKQKLILVAARAVFTQFSTDEQTFAHTQIWKNLLRRACTTLLWAGERDGVRVQVWGNTQIIDSHPSHDAGVTR